MILRYSCRESYSIIARLCSSKRTNNLIAVALEARRFTSTSSTTTTLEATQSFSPTAKLKCEQDNKACHDPANSNSNKNSDPAELRKRPLKKSIKHKSEDLSSYSKQRRINHEKIALLSYLNVCVDVGQINRAFNTVINMSENRKNSSLIDVNHYNIVLKGWARLGAQAQVMETRMLMIRRGVEPNAESYAFSLLALTKQTPVSERKSSIRRLYLDMRTRSFDARNLFHHVYLSPMERRSVVALIRSIENKFQEKFCPNPLGYDCELLKNFKQTKSVPYEFSGIPDMSKLNNWADSQRNIETLSSIPIKSVAKVKDFTQQSDKCTKVWNKLTEMWNKRLRAALEESLKLLLNQAEDPSRIHLYPYLCSISKNTLIQLLLDEIEINATQSSFSMSTNQLHKNLGIKVMNRYLLRKSIEDGSHNERQKIYTEYLQEYCTNPELSSLMTPREFIQQKAEQTLNYSIYKGSMSLVDEWPHNILVSLGRLLYNIILREIKFDPEVVGNPKRDIVTSNLVHAFYTAYIQVNGSHKIKEEFRSHLDFEKLQQRANAVKLKFDYSFLPCSSPPLPWISRKFGGYLCNRSDLIRLSSFSERNNVEWQPNQNQQLFPSLDSLNAIGICPWIVNKGILDLAIKVFCSGGDTDLDIPLNETKFMQTETVPKLKEMASKADKILYNKDKKRFDQRRRAMYSLWRDCLYRLSIANHYRDKVFWFPHNMDFRGRTYPIPPHFNHLGADLARSLLLFSKGRPLGEKGLDWLKIHLVNLIGTKKSCSLQERLEYANSILHLEVLDSADNPQDGRRWWVNNENSWQVLACCKEIANAIRSGDHKNYISHFPVHQDGSCNGLQHYAALGRDSAGALAVNLIPCNKPQDVYSRVVDIVEKMRQTDAESGNKDALLLNGIVQRKVIKQTVMTTVYGVTRYGARLQIAKQLATKGVSDGDIWRAATYLTSKTFDSIGQMFNKSRLIQAWLNECAHIIASKFDEPVSWTTPLGFTAIQPYTLFGVTSANRQGPKALIGDKAFIDSRAALNVPKQRNAFPPNYIHSLDSSHMMLTSLHCMRQGVTFVSVHDCFWTHPSTVDEMNKICREQFVSLHSEPLLQDLSDQFIARIAWLDKGDSSGAATSSNFAHSDIDQARVKIMNVPSTGDLDLNQVLKSTYFFS